MLVLCLFPFSFPCLFCILFLGEADNGFDRSGAAGVGFFGWMTFMAAVNYLAVVFQAVYGDSATGSGVDLLSLIVVQTVIIVLMGK